jgi:hypothetical protein
MGTTFTVSVPVNVSTGVHRSDSGLKIQNLTQNSSNLVVAQPKILIAMNYLYNIRQAEILFSNLNCEVDTAETVSELFEVYGSRPSGFFNAIILGEYLCD